MAHSTFKLNGTVLMRDDVISMILSRFTQFVGIHNNSQRYSWLLDAIADWSDEFETMPPGAKCIDLERWIVSKDRQAIFVEGIEWMEGNLSDWIEQEKLANLRAGGSMNLQELKALVQTARIDAVPSS